MKRIGSRNWPSATAAYAAIVFITVTASARTHKPWPDKYAVVVMPVSLAVGTVRTSEFTVVGAAYEILLQFEKPLPFDEERCMLGATLGPLDEADCRKSNVEPLLQTEWTVRDGDRIVERGKTATHVCTFEDKHIYMCVGVFTGEVGKDEPATHGNKYVVEIKFTKDAAALNVTNPRLIVIKHDDFFGKP